MEESENAINVHEDMNFKYEAENVDLDSTSNSTSKENSDTDTYEEDEVFFGKISEKEMLKMKKLGSRKTEIPAYLSNLSRESMEVVEDKGFERIKDLREIIANLRIEEQSPNVESESLKQLTTLPDSQRISKLVEEQNEKSVKDEKELNSNSDDMLSLPNDFEYIKRVTNDESFDTKQKAPTANSQSESGMNKPEENCALSMTDRSENNMEENCALSIADRSENDIEENCATSTADRSENNLEKNCALSIADRGENNIEENCATSTAYRSENNMGKNCALSIADRSENDIEVNCALSTADMSENNMEENCVLSIADRSENDIEENSALSTADRSENNIEENCALSTADSSENNMEENCALFTADSCENNMEKNCALSIADRSENDIEENCALSTADRSEKKMEENCALSIADRSENDIKENCALSTADRSENNIEENCALSTADSSENNKSIKRDSFFTNLKIIDVNDSKIYEGFCVEEQKVHDSESYPACELDNIDECLEEEPVYTVDESVVNKSNCISHSCEVSSISVQSTDNANLSASLSSEGYSSHGNPNQGMILSSGVSSLDSACETEKMSNNSKDSLFIEICTELSSKDVSGFEEDLSMDDDNLPDNASSSSPDRKFNDTVEEMEMLLKHGMQYFEKNSINVFNSNEDENQMSINNDSSVIDHKRQSTISSSQSVQSFNPIFDSTRTSAENVIKSNEKEEKPDKEQDEFTVPEMGKIPPPKPPRLNVPLLTLTTCEPHSIMASKVPLKEQTPKTPKNKVPHMHSPIAKSLTKSRIECLSTPKHKISHLKKSNLTNNNKTPLSRPLFKPPIISPSLIGRSAQKDYFKTPTTAAKCKLATKSNLHRPFFTPQEKGRHQTIVRKAPQLSQKLRGLNIVSPVARYLRDNPPPPLIATVKPRYKLSPQKLEALSPSPTKQCTNKPDLNESCLNREAALMRNEDSLNKLVSKLNAKSPLKEANSPPKTKGSNSTNCRTILPPSVYVQAGAIQLENKENSCRVREISSDHPPALVVKHKGRTQVPKSQQDDRRRSPTSEGRVSMMEVSVYETHLVEHTNTLK